VELRYLDSVPGMNIWKHDNALVTAANSYFGSLRRARLAAGRDPTQRASWQREIIQRLQDEYVRGTLDRHADSFTSPLHVVAERHFGSWERALKAAGIKPEKHASVPKRLRSRKTA
jgi:hypothetical protein